MTGAPLPVHGRTGSMFVGRAAELEALRTAVGSLPTLVVVEGTAGIGKTALVRAFVQGLTGFEVISASAAETESDVALAMVDHILRRLGSPSVAGAESTRLEVGTKLLEAITDAAPLVLFVDDVHWADPESISALVFATRRLVDDDVLVVLGTRSGQLPRAVERLVEDPAGHLVSLRPLDEAEIVELAGLLDVELSPRAARRLREHTGGAPLYVRALLTEVQSQLWSRDDVELPAPREFAAVVAGWLASVSGSARALCEAVAVLGRSSLTLACELAAEVDGPAAEDPSYALDETIERELLARDSERDLTPAHPLVGAAILAAMSEGRRDRLHRAAAGLAPDEAAALRHRAAAAGGPDAQLADDLEALARHTEGRQGGVAALLAASRLTPDPQTRERRLLQAVEWLLVSGDLAQARTFAIQLEAVGPSARRDCALAGLALIDAQLDVAGPLLASAWRERPADDGDLAASIAYRSAYRAALLLRDDEVAEWTQRAIELTRDVALRANCSAVRALALWRLGRSTDAYALLGDQAPTVLGMRGWLRCADDNLDTGRADLAAALEGALRLGAASAAATFLTVLGRAHFAAGDWQDALVAAERAIEICDALEHAPIRVFAWWGAILVPAARGDWAACDALAARARSQPAGTPDRQAAVGLTLALPAASRGDHDEVLAALGGVASLSRASDGRRGGVDAPGCWHWQDLYAEALVGNNRLGEADAFLHAHEAIAKQAQHRSAIARLARVRGRLEAVRRRTEHAQAAFETARDAIAGLGMPYDEAHIRLAHGQMLRRGGQRRAAAVELLAAIEVFDALGARPALERAESELEACGRTIRRRSALEHHALTAQEEAVARLVSTGRTNREVAQELLLSVKTVEQHLTRIYGKLDLRSRSELVARVLGTGH